MISRPVVLGNASFKKKIERLPNQIQSVIKSHQWSIHKGKYQKQNWKQIFEQLLTANITLLYLYDNFYDHILKEISIVNFPALQVISLVNNNIKNIQAFTFINCKTISHIYMNFNDIQSIDCLSKCQLINLQYFSLRKNPINQINIERYNTLHLKTLIFQGILQDNLSVQDCSFLSKIKIFKGGQNLNPKTNLGIIGIKSQQRLRQFKIVKVLKCKFKNLKLDYPKKQIEQ